ncbi:MAG: GGDEF and EAL domain-containing protein [Acidimicrobiales bacterium]|nr:GGDEF and EAL domain-containing protein [Acidimicrobiales bacterium]
MSDSPARAPDVARLLDAAPVALGSLDGDGRLRTANAALAALLGRPVAELLGRRVAELAPPLGEPGSWTSALASALRGRPSTVRVALGNHRAAEVRLAPAAGDQIALAALDLAERQRAERSLARRAADLEEVEALTHLGSWYRDEAGGQLVWSAEMSRLYGLSDGTRPTMAILLERLPAEDARRLFDAHRELVAHGTPFRFAHRVVRPDGSVRHARSHGEPVVDANGRLLAVRGTTLDVTELVELQDALHATTAELAEARLRDPLTGLANRRLLSEALERSLARLTRREGAVAIVFVDLDAFKAVNDALGHARADGVLAEIAQRIGGAVRPADLVARVGGDEFVVLLDDLERPTTPLDVARRIQRALSAPVVAVGHDLRLTAGCGVAVTRRPATRPDELLRRADTALYQAKQTGPGGLELFDDTLESQLHERHELAKRLAGALERGELLLHYQPEIDLRTGTVVAIEALVRWRPDEEPPLTADGFVDLADDIGCLADIDAWVLREAFARAAAWCRTGQGTPTLRVNVSGRLLGTPDGASLVAAELDAAGLDPASVCLEVDGHTAPRAGPAVLAALGRLRALGVGIALSRFDTAPATLDFLRASSVSQLVLDPRTVLGLGGDPFDEAVVAGSLTSARALGIDVTAVGVERPAQLDALRRLGCHRVQGHLLAPPAPAPWIDDLLAGRAAVTVPP